MALIIVHYCHKVQSNKILLPAVTQINNIVITLIIVFSLERKIYNLLVLNGHTRVVWRK